jgi:hypothetical protein
MKFKPLLLIVLIFTAGCFEVTEFTGVPIRQYADQVIDFSSQYSATSWSANRALGKENVYPIYDDLPNAWASKTADEQREYLVLGFDTIQTVNRIEIFETYYPGAIDTVYLRNADTGKWKLIYSRPAETDLPEEARIKSIFLVETTYLVDAIRIAINSPAITDALDEFGNEIYGWNEIDAVVITGQRKK